VDPYNWITDPATDPTLFFIGFQDAYKISFPMFFLAYYLLLVHLQQYSKILNKVIISHKIVKIKVFSEFFAC
jgi:hypothetical protein